MPREVAFTGNDAPALLDRNPAAGSGLGGGQGAPQVPPEQQIVPVTTAPEQPAPGATSRPLLREDSDTSAGEKDAAELIAIAAKENAEAGRFHSTDENVSNTLEFNLRTYHQHLVMLEKAFNQQPPDVERAAFATTLPPHVSKFVAFAAKCVLGAQCYAHIGPIGERMRDIQEKCPSVVGVVAQAIIKLAEFKSASSAALDLSMLNLRQKQLFTESALYRDFLKARLSARLSAVMQDHKGSPTARLAIVKDGAAQHGAPWSREGQLKGGQ